MAFTTRSAKDTRAIVYGSTPEEVGPGYYPLDDGFVSKGETFAPFSSMKERLGDDVAAAQAPPPGSYDIPNKRGGNGPGTTPSGLPCKFVPFKSTADRFNGPGSAFGSVKSESKPDPGAYKLKSMSDMGPPSECKTMGVAPRGIAELRALSAPSIPVGDQCWGYSEGPRGLVRHAGPRKYAGTKKDFIGPNVYDPNLALVKSVPGGMGRTFGRSTRKPMVLKTAAPDPGTYALKGFGLKAVRPSASNMSNSERKGSGGPTGLLLERVMSEPGPGSYNPGGPQAKAMSKVKNKRQEFQFFDSTAERFPSTSLREEEEKLMPGPGQYVLAPIDIRVPDFKKMKDERFGGWGDFTEPHRDIFFTPGPGTYETELQIDEEQGYGETMKGATPLHSFSVLSHQGSAAFGSTTKRFVPKKEKDEYPGPMKYPMEDRGSKAMDDAYAQKVRTSMPDNAFQSRFDRMRERSKHLQEVRPEPTAYSPQLPSAHIPRVKPPAEGFGSQDRRFKYVSEHPFPGPGHYPPGAAIGHNPSINRGVAAGLGFASSESRDDETIRLNEKEAVPGPGTYDTAGEWVQKSYNQIFNPNVLKMTG